MDRRAAVSTFGLALLTMGVTTAVTWVIARAQPHSGLSSTPTYVAFGVALVGAALALAAFTDVGPFGRLRSIAEVLDDCIREGNKARNRIVSDKMSHADSAVTAFRWEALTMRQVEKHYPAILAEYILAMPGDEATPGSQAEAIRTLAVKLAVLSEARRELGG